MSKKTDVISFVVTKTDKKIIENVQRKMGADSISVVVYEAIRRILIKNNIEIQ